MKLRTAILPLSALLLAGAGLATVPPPAGLSAPFATAAETRAAQPSLSVGTPTVGLGRMIRNTISLSSLDAYPDFVIEIHRDGVLVNAITASGLTTANGDEVSRRYSEFTYTDNNVTPGQVHNYLIVARLYEGGPELTREYSARASEISFDVLAPTYYEGTVALTISPAISTSNYPQARYLIYRDGEKICEFPGYSDGSDANGNTWSRSTSGVMRFVNAGVLPGREYLYSVVAQPYEGFQVAENRFLSVSMPNLRLTASRVSGDTAVLSFQARPQGFEVDFEIHRDGVKIAEFGSRENGSSPQGYQWSTSNYDLQKTFRDSTLEPLSTYNYRVVTKYAADCRSDDYATAGVHTGSIAEERGLVVTDAYVPVLMRLSTGEYLLAATVKRPETADAELTVYAGGGAYVFVDSGTASVDLSPSDFPPSGMKNLYMIAPEYVDPNASVVDLHVARSPTE